MYTTIETTHGLTQEQWEDKLYREYLGEFPLKELMGTDSDAVIQVKEELMKQVGDAITIGVRAKLTGAGVTGLTRLKDQEEALNFYDQRITIDEFRHGVALKGKMSQKRVAFDLREQAKEALTDWNAEKLENDVITGLTDTSIGRVRGRYLYGAVDGNWDATHATALTNVDDTADKLTLAMLSLAKRKAEFGTSIKMRPFSVKAKGLTIARKYICLAHPLAIRDLKADTTWTTLMQNLIQGGEDQVPTITGSTFLGEYDGIYIYSYDRIPLIASTIQVAHNVLLGAQAAAVVWGEKTTWAEELDDYQAEHGFKIGEIRGVSKLVFSRATPEDNGVVNVFSAAVADA